MIRSLIREILLQESNSPTSRAASKGMAVCKIGDRVGHVLIYDPGLLVNYVKYARAKEAIPEVIEDSIEDDPVVRSGVVYARRVEGLGECHGGGVVLKSASWPGSGMGPAAYEAAMWYAGGLTSDRMETSRAAGRVWLNYKGRSVSGDIESLPFDDLNDPKTPPPNDDCVMQDREWLNYSYRLKSPPPGLEEMEGNHEKTKSIIKGLGYPVETLEHKLKLLFMMIFDERMSEDET
jgi:hypothetical protein